MDSRNCEIELQPSLYHYSLRSENNALPSPPSHCLFVNMMSTIRLGLVMALSVAVTSAFSPFNSRSLCGPATGGIGYHCMSAEDENDATPVDANDAFPFESKASKPVVKCPDCDQCDGSGRILGGIATVLTFWPIKAYRPCPNFIERGGRYVRSGQGLDEIAFGRDSTYNPNDR